MKRVGGRPCQIVRSSFPKFTTVELATSRRQIYTPFPINRETFANNVKGFQLR